MDVRFVQLAHSLTEKGISLDDFSVALQYFSEPKFKKISKRLKEREIELEQFHYYLAKENSNASPQLVEVCFRLLNESKITLTDLNPMLVNLPAKYQNPNNFLRSLMELKKISPEDFFQILQNKSPKTEVKSAYSFRNTATGFEFYIRNQKKNTFGPYQILEELGRGGMGVVYKAYHPGLNKIVALKSLIEGEGVSEKKLKRFHREIQVMGQLKDKGIIEILDSGTEKKKHYFVMEYVDGTPLTSLLHRKGSLRKKVIVIQKVLNSLNYAHQKGILHRDLKLGNIFLTQEEEPKIGDFGLSTNSLDPEELKLTRTGSLLGTAPYMPPEQAQGKIELFDNRSDLYSIGVCLYRLITNKFPFEGKNINALIEQIVSQEPKPPNKLNPNIHLDLNRIVLKSLDKEPKKRYQNATQFAEDLDRFLKGVPIFIETISWQQKCLYWKRKYWKSFSVFFFLIFLFFLFLGGLYSTKLREKQATFSRLYQQSLQWKKKAKQLSSQNFNVASQKLKYLFEAYNALNSAFTLEFNNSLIEKEKLNVGKSLILLASRLKEDILADYFLQEIEQLSCITTSEFAAFKDKIEYYRSTASQKNFQRFQEWLNRLNGEPLKEWEKRDFAFEISQMKEKEIQLRLLLILAEGHKYFYQNRIKNLPEKEAYYLLIVKIIGRSEEQKYSPYLWKSLVLIAKKLKELPLKEQRIEEINYAVSLTEAIGNLKDSQYCEGIQKIRSLFGPASSFYDRTKVTYKKLLNEKEEKRNTSLMTALDYEKRADEKQAKGQNQSALKDYNIALKMKPDSVGTLVNRGLTKKRLNDCNGAILDYNKALALKPDLAIGYFNRAVVYHFMKKYPEALADYSKAIQFSPKFANAYSERGNVKKELKDYAGAMADQNIALQIDPSFFGAYNDRANLRIELGDIDGAIEDYSMAIQINPKYSIAYSNRGSLKGQKKDLEGAIADHTKAIELNPQYATAYFNRGNEKRKLGDLKGALLDYDEALRIEPTNDSALSNRGSLRQALGDPSGALADFNLSLSLNPNHYSALINRGVLRKEMGLIQEALQDINLCVKLAPNNFKGYENRAGLRLALKDFKGTMEDCKKALKLNENSSPAYYYRSIIYENFKKFPAAIEDLNKVILIEPHLPNAYLRRANILFKLTKSKVAEKDYKTYLKLTERKNDAQVLKVRKWILLKFPKLKK